MLTPDPDQARLTAPNVARVTNGTSPLCALVTRSRPHSLAHIISADPQSRRVRLRVKPSVLRGAARDALAASRAIDVVDATCALAVDVADEMIALQRSEPPVWYVVRVLIHLMLNGSRRRANLMNLCSHPSCNWHRAQRYDPLLLLCAVCPPDCRLPLTSLLASASRTCPQCGIYSAFPPPSATGRIS